MHVIYLYALYVYCIDHRAYMRKNNLLLWTFGTQTSFYQYLQAFLRGIRLNIVWWYMIDEYIMYDV